MVCASPMCMYILCWVELLKSCIYGILKQDSVCGLGFKVQGLAKSFLKVSRCKRSSQGDNLYSDVGFGFRALGLRV